MHQHRQIHVWISESDYLMLREQSVETRESVSAIVRRLIKSERQRQRESVSVRSDRSRAQSDSLEEILRQYAS